MTAREKILLDIRSALAHYSNFTEKNMFGKRAFMVNNKLCIAVGKEEIMCRIDPTLQTASQFITPYEPVVMKGKEMRGYFRIKNHDVQSESEIQFWINLCLDYNKKISK